MNAEMLRNMSIIAEDENLLKRATKYLCKLEAEKESDSTRLSKEDSFERIEEARKQSKYQFFLFCFLNNRTAPMMMPKKTARENTY